MFEKFKADMMFKRLLRRPDIDKAYAMVKPSDPWYATIKKVHDSVAEIRKMPRQTVQILSHDGLRLEGMFYPNGGDITVVCIHGYTSHAEREWAFPGLFYLSLGYNVLIPYQRAHGPSEGKYITLGALEQEDMQGWVRKVQELVPGSRVIIHGLSMGGGIALDLASKELENVRAIISDAPSVSVKGMFEQIAKGVFKKDGEKVAAILTARFEKEFGVDVGRLDRVQTLSNSRYPILLSAGSNEGMEEIFTVLKSRNPQPTEVIILPGCDHGNGMYKQTQMYQQTIEAFIKSAV